MNGEFRGKSAELAVPERREPAARYVLLFHRTHLERHVSHVYSHASMVGWHNINDPCALNRCIRESGEAAGSKAGPDIRTRVVDELGYIRAVVRSADMVAPEAESMMPFDYRRMQQDLKNLPGTVASQNFNASATPGERPGDVLAQQGGNIQMDCPPCCLVGRR